MWLFVFLLQLGILAILPACALYSFGLSSTAITCLVGVLGFYWLCVKLIPRWWLDIASQ